MVTNAPNGYNAYDSMGEYYMNEGDLEKALSFYEKAINMFPGANNAGNTIDELEVKIANKDKGNLLLINSEYVQPEHTADYIQWGKEYKELADSTNFKDFFVSRGDGAFHYIVNVGKEQSGVDAYREEWNTWSEANAEVGEMYEKYKHTIHRTERSLWRHVPSHSYTPEAANDSANTYTRVYYAYTKYGHEDAIMDLLSEFKDIWKANGISEGFQVYRNIFGTDNNCIAIVSSYDGSKGWAADDEEVMTKVGQETLQGIITKWNTHIRKADSAERYPQPNLSHSNPEEN